MDDEVMMEGGWNSTGTFPTAMVYGTGPGVVNGESPTDREIRLRESAVAFTVEYFKNNPNVGLDEFDAKLHSLYRFLKTGSLSSDVQQAPADTPIGF